MGAGLRREADLGGGAWESRENSSPNCRSWRRGRVGPTRGWGVTRELEARLGCGRSVRDRGVAREADKRAGGVAEES